MKHVRIFVLRILTIAVSKIEVIELPGRKATFTLLVILLIIILIPVGCGKKQSASQKPQSSDTGQKPKAPAAAEDILKDVTAIIAELDRKTKLQKVPGLEQASQDGGQSGQMSQGAGSSKGGQGSQSGGSQSGKSSSSSKSGGQQPSQGGGQKGMASWQKEMQSLKNLHSNWNMLEPQAAEAGLSPSSRDGFERTLDNLTLAVSSRRLEESLTAAIELYGQYGELARIYAIPQPVEFYQVQYGVMAAMAEASREKWDTAREKIDATEDPWSMLLPRVSKQDKMLAQRVDFSLRDLKSAISSQEMNLVAIKGEIAMNNFKALEKKLSQSRSPSGSQ